MTKKLTSVVLVIVLVLALLALLRYVVLPEIRMAAGPRPEVFCRTVLDGIGSAMKESADNNAGKLPFEPN